MSVRSPLAPDRWPKQDLDRSVALQAVSYNEAATQLNSRAVSSKGMVAGTSEPFAVHAGLEALRHGGSAADAALTTALAQVALTAGSTISYAGVMTAIYYDESAGTTFTLNAGYNTVQEEKDPRTIPVMGSHSGRTALVPGFMGGVQALHDRFGQLSFEALFGPAVWVASEGVAVGPMVTNLLQAQERFITRLPDTKRIFTKPNGKLYWYGDIFRQPELARTLTNVATQGTEYMYRGEWAHRFVEAVRREGGKITLDDLADYRAQWTEPLRIQYGGYEVVSLGAPNIGGMHTLSALKLAEAANIKRLGHYATSSEALYSLIQISRLQRIFAFTPRSELEHDFPDIDWSPTSLVSTDTAGRLWTYLRKPAWQSEMLRLLNRTVASNHSAGVLAVDEKGNVAAILHSCNCYGWGTTGLFVDGVSIPDSASFQQRQIGEAGAGVRLPDPSNPLIVLKGGEPVLASTGVGSSLHEVTLQSLINVLDFHMEPRAAVDQPNYYGPSYEVTGAGETRLELEKETVREGAFPEDLLIGVRSRGQAIKPIKGDPPMAGTWIGIWIDPNSRERRGGVPSRLRAHVEGY